MKEFHQMREEFHPHETHMARLPILNSLGNCAIKLCIETALRRMHFTDIIDSGPVCLSHNSFMSCFFAKHLFPKQLHGEAVFLLFSQRHKLG